MKLYKLIFLIFLFPKISYADIKILNWQENAQLTETGKNSEILVRGKVENIASNQFASAFTISFDPKQNIKINKVVFDYNVATYSFSNNALKVKFTPVKENNQNFTIYFTYTETYDKINEFLRLEEIYVPDFAAGADAKIAINFPGYLESATLNPNITKIGNSFVYNGKVGVGGINEAIKLTPAQSAWDVVVRVKMNSNQPLKKTSISFPNYFRNSGQKVENFSVAANVMPIKQSAAGNIRKLDFDSEKTQLVIENKAKILVSSNREAISRNSQNYLKVSQEEIFLLSNLLEDIHRNPRYQALPLYAKIGQFVHEFIKYDISYVGKLPKVKEIINNPIGVCTEYATLYNSLARLAKIPSLIVDGAACGEYNKCQGHAWNMIYYDNKWINVDATWDLMSGLVSSSHIYFNDNDEGEVKIQYIDNKEKIIDYNLDFEMKNFI
jgi:hypothetical protein